MTKNRQKIIKFHQFGIPFFQGACLCWKKRKWLVSEAHGVVRVRLLPWPSCLPDEQNHGFVTDSDPHGSKSGSEGIPWQLFSSRISWQAPNPAMVGKMTQNIRGFGSGWVGIFRNFRIFPKWKTATLVGQDSAWEVQKRYFLPKNRGFGLVFTISHYMGVSPGSPYWPLLAPL